METQRIEIVMRQWLVHMEDHLKDEAEVDTTETGGETCRNVGSADLQSIWQPSTKSQVLQLPSPLKLTPFISPNPPYFSSHGNHDQAPHMFSLLVTLSSYWTPMHYCSSFCPSLITWNAITLHPRHYPWTHIFL